MSLYLENCCRLLQLETSFTHKIPICNARDSHACLALLSHNWQNHHWGISKTKPSTKKYETTANWHTPNTRQTLLSWNVFYRFMNVNWLVDKLELIKCQITQDACACQTTALWSQSHVITLVSHEMCPPLTYITFSFFSSTDVSLAKQS